MPRATGTKRAKAKPAKPYKHPEADSPMRPEVGTQAQFKKKLPPKTYKYDSSLSPAMDWDGQNPAREQGEARIATTEVDLSAAMQCCAALDGMLKATQLSTSMIAEGARSVRQHVTAAQSAVRELKAISKPFLNWAGKAERLSFDVPSLPLFIHERLSTKAILETLKGHRKQGELFDLFSDPQHSIADQVLHAYEYRDNWVNRMILGDSNAPLRNAVRRQGCRVLPITASRARNKIPETSRGQPRLPNHTSCCRLTGRVSGEGFTPFQCAQNVPNRTAQDASERRRT
jgi:adenine-specific DNA-methyltransferase